MVRKIVLVVYIVVVLTAALSTSSETFSQNNPASMKQLVGVGLVLVADKEHNKIIVAGVLDHSPAKEANICKGDILLAVDGNIASPNELEQIVSQVRGIPGTSVILTINHIGQESDVRLTRKKFSIPRGRGCSNKGQL